jgi:hypothetical protein
MGQSDNYSLPVIVFSIVYLGFITLMYASINLSGGAYSNLGINQNDLCDCGVLTCAEYKVIYGADKTAQLCNSQISESNTGLSIGNFVTNFQQLGVWNLLFFSPILIGLAYIFLVLFIPNWL